MPIVVRYGPAGEGLRAAQQAGAGERFQRRFGMEQQLVEGARQQYRHQDRMALQAERQRMQNQLQRAKLAQEARRRPTDTRTIRGGSPLTQNVQDLVQKEMKRRSAQQEQQTDPYRYGPYAETGPTQPSATLTTGDETFTLQDGQVVGQRGGQPIPQEEIDQRTGFVRTAQPARVSPTAAAKQSYLESLGGQRLPAPLQQSLQQMIANDQVDPKQFRLMANQALEQVQRQQGMAPASRQRERIQGIDNQIRRIEREAKEIADTLRERGYDPSGPPTQFVQPTRQPGGTTEEFYRGAADVLAPGQPFSDTGGGMADPEAFQAYKKMAHIQSQIADLLEERQQMTQTGQRGQGGQIGSDAMLLNDMSGLQAGQQPQGPQPGDVEDGYRFQGGDPSNPDNWEKI